jgi:cyclophilin family peptidyl-prolyl cis-trans isomerase
MPRAEATMKRILGGLALVGASLGPIVCCSEAPEPPPATARAADPAPPELLPFEARPAAPDTEAAAPTSTPDSSPVEVIRTADPGGETLEYVVMDTSQGAIVLELDRAAAPVTVANFLRYVDEGFYDGTIIHLVAPGRIIQGGGFEPGLRPRPGRGAPIVNEWRNGLRNGRGTIAMARLAAADSATTQFFINLDDNRQFDMAGHGRAGYAVFGRIVAGMDVADAIGGVDAGQKGGFPAVPIIDVVLRRMARLGSQEAGAMIERAASAPDAPGRSEQPR